MEFPVLYKLNGHNKLMKWKISISDNIIFREDGLVLGKLKSSERRVEGNTLRSASEQVVLEAEKMWLQQLDKGYHPDEADLGGQKIFQHVLQQKQQNGGMNRGVKMFSDTEITASTTVGTITGIYSPMLAQKYTEQKSKVKFNNKKFLNNKYKL